MADEVDVTQERIEREIEIMRRAIAAMSEETQPIGECLWCGEVTEYQPGTPEWRGQRMEDYDPGNPPDLSYEAYYPDGTKADDLIESLPLIEKIRFEDEVLERAHEEWSMMQPKPY